MAEFRSNRIAQTDMLVQKFRGTAIGLFMVGSVAGPALGKKFRSGFHTKYDDADI